MGYKISALESRDKKKLTSADLNFFKGQQCLTFLAISKDRSRRSDKIRYTDSLLLPPTLADVMSVQPTTPLLHTGQLQMVMMSSG